jgi:hypothetical protein
MIFLMLFACAVNISMLRKNRGCCPIHLTNEEKREEKKKFRIVTAFQAAIVDDG